MMNRFDVVLAWWPQTSYTDIKERRCVVFEDNGDWVKLITVKTVDKSNYPKYWYKIKHFDDIFTKQGYLSKKEYKMVPKHYIIDIRGRLNEEDINDYIKETNNLSTLHEEIEVNNNKNEIFTKEQIDSKTDIRLAEVKKINAYKYHKDSLPVYFTGMIRDSYRVNVFDDSFRFIVADKQNKIISVYGKYSQNGMMILSTSRNEKSPEENKKAAKELQQDIRAKNLGYVSTLGGYEEEDKTTGLPVKVTELSFIVPYNPNVISQEDFFEFAVDMCKKYNQDSVLIQVPWYNDGKPTYINKNGGDADFQVSPDKHLADPDKDTYYTQIKGTNRAFKFGDNKKKIYFGIHVPSSLADAYHIKYSGEITR